MLCAVCDVQCAVCCVQCAVCSVQCVVCSVRCAMCSVQCSYMCRELHGSATRQHPLVGVGRPDTGGDFFSEVNAGD